MGQPLYRKVEPTGYSLKNADWLNSAALLGRMNFSLALVSNRIPGIKVDLTPYQNAADPNDSRPRAADDRSLGERQESDSDGSGQSGDPAAGQPASQMPQPVRMGMQDAGMQQGRGRRGMDIARWAVADQQDRAAGGPDAGLAGFQRR